MTKKKVLLRAPLLTNSGYGVHSRQLFEWLFKKEDIDLTVECLKWGNTSWLIDPNDLDGLVGKIMSCSRDVKKELFDISFQVQLPDEWDIKLAKKNIGVTAAVETDICSQSWIDNVNKMDEIIVPSSFTKNVLLNSGIVNKHINVVPEWFNKKSTDRSGISKTLNNKEFDKIDNNFNFLVVGQLTAIDPETDRKNIFNTIKWLCEEFKDNKDVGIVIKTNMGRSSDSDKKNVINYFKKVIETIRNGSDYPKIKVLHGKMTDLEIMSLYNHNKIKAYVSCTRGEGYGLPLIEAASSGLPIIATNWSGHLDFLADQFTPVDYHLVDLPPQRIDERIFVNKSKWANPSEESFKKSIRNVYENYYDAKEKSKNLKKHVLQNFNDKLICNEYDKIFKRVINK